MNSKNKIQQTLNKLMAQLAIILAIVQFGQLIIVIGNNSKDSKDTQGKNQDIINNLQSAYGTTLAIPQIISEQPSLSYSNYSNLVATLEAEDAQMAFAEFQNVLACPMGVYVEQDEHFYKTAQDNIPLDFVRVRITNEYSYISYKYLDLAYTLKINQKTSIDVLLKYIGISLEDLVETDAEQLNIELGATKEEKEAPIESDNIYGKYKLPFNLSSLNIMYGIDSTDGQVSLYIGNKLIMKIIDTDKLGTVPENIIVYRQSKDSSISLIEFNAEFELDSEEYDSYLAFIMVLDVLVDGIELADSQ